MQKDKNFYIVDKSVLPEIFLRVMDVKNLLESGKEKTVQDAVQKVGISRSAFYKYRDAIFPLFENTRGKTVTVALNLDNTSGLLSMVLNGMLGPVRKLAYATVAIAEKKEAAAE